MRILSIGNSFSQDAQRYLHLSAKKSGVQLDTVNLYIGGCSLERHYTNMLGDIKDYMLEFNGQSTGFRTTIKEALLNGPWDVITLQQVSRFSFDYSTYTPYITELAGYVRKFAPKAKIVIHQTWFYEDGSQMLDGVKYQSSRAMLDDAIASYNKAFEDISADGIIPSGEMMYKLYKGGIDKVHRDSFHATLGAGRYALALLWFRMLCGVSVTGNELSEFDVPVSEEEKKIIFETVDSFDPIKWG